MNTPIATDPDAPAAPLFTVPLPHPLEVPWIERALAGSRALEWPFDSYIYRLRPQLEPNLTVYEGIHVLGVQLSGQCEIRIHNQPLRYRGRGMPGNILLTPMSSEAQLSWDQSVDLMVFFMPDALLVKAAQSMAPTTSISAVALQRHINVPNPLVAHLARALADEMQTGGLYGPLYAETLFNSLLMTLLRDYSSLKGHAADPTDANAPAPPLRHVIEYLNDHLSEKLSIEQLATQAHLSPSHFVRLFKRQMGMAPHQYIIQQRVQRARDLLEFSTLTIGEIALAVGFTDNSHLTHHFRQSYGAPPTAVVRRMKAQ